MSLVLVELGVMKPELYSRARVGVPYPNEARRRCDLVVPDGAASWFVEVKLLRILGDNGKPNDNMLMHILSPYQQHRSALTDCEKLAKSGFNGHRAVLIYGFEYVGWPLEPAVSAFEALARERVHLGERHAVGFRDLCHPIHREGSVYGWEIG